MARIHAVSDQTRTRLTEGWEMAIAPAEWRPESDAALDWLPAPVPGTAAQALENAGKTTPELLAALQCRHIWYRRPYSSSQGTKICFEGLAPHADIYLGGQRVANARSMFDPVEVELEKQEKTIIYLHFKPLDSETVSPSPRRQKWRPHLIAGPHMRNARATLLGHMPGWCPPVLPVGPYRGVEQVVEGPVTARNASVRTRLEGATGVVEISIEINGMDGDSVAHCFGVAALMQRGGNNRRSATLRVENPPLWWPHTHGDPHLLPLDIYGEDVEISLGFVGFRTIELDPDNNGFGLICNGVPIFCRGANWTNADVMRLPGEPEDYAPLLRRARDAGMNMLRVSGIMTREAPAFYEMADKLGILIWHDECFANFDYDFDHLEAEFGINRSLSEFLGRIETSPSLAVVCGGSEMAQQGAMLSLPESVWSSRWCTETLPAIVAAARPDVITVPNSPWGGELPFQVNAGVSHYYGVGAYQRPLEDARRAEVRFASECLAFAQLPQPEHMARHSGGTLPGSEAWRARVVRDLKADWDFEDTRDFYCGLLYGVDVARLKADQPERYLALSCATPGEVMEATFAEWRRVGSVTRGGLVWFLADLGPGFGWGVIDCDGLPKPAYYALKRAFRPVTVVMTDEGVNGLHLHVINERGIAQRLMLTLTCLGADGAVVMDGAREMVLPPRSSEMVTATSLFGLFFDVTYAYRFGPPAHDVSVARLADAETGEFIAEAFHFPQGRGSHVGDSGLKVELIAAENGQHALRLTTERLAQSVHIALEGFEPDDDWFHLAPGPGRLIALKGQGEPRGVVTALNHAGRVTFG